MGLDVISVELLIDLGRLPFSFLNSVNISVLFVLPLCVCVYIPGGYCRCDGLGGGSWLVCCFFC